MVCTSRTDREALAGATGTCLQEAAFSDCFDACPFFDGRVYSNGSASEARHSKLGWETPDLQQEIGQRSTDCRHPDRYQTGAQRMGTDAKVGYQESV
jgi:hypothetical protein